jgi:hypothetical protein
MPPQELDHKGAASKYSRPNYTRHNQSQALEEEYSKKWMNCGRMPAIHPFFR